MQHHNEDKREGEEARRNRDVDGLYSGRKTPTSDGQRSAGGRHHCACTFYVYTTVSLLPSFLSRAAKPSGGHRGRREGGATTTNELRLKLS